MSIDDYSGDDEDDPVPSQERLISADAPCTSDTSIDILALGDDGYDDFDIDHTREGSLSRRGNICPTSHGKIVPIKPGIVKPLTTQPAKKPEPLGPNKDTPFEINDPCEKYENKPYLLTCAGPEVVRSARNPEIIYVGFCNEGKFCNRRDHQIRHQTNPKCSAGPKSYHASDDPSLDVTKLSEYCCEDWVEHVRNQID